MAPRKSLKRRIMKEFIISELSAVDVPAQGGALAVLMKRNDETVKSGETEMTDAERKQMNDLQKKVEELTSALETAKAANTSAEELTKQLAEAKEALEKAEAAAAEAEIISKMSDDEKEHMAALDDDGKTKFKSMSSDERKRAMKKSDDSNPVVYKSERTGEEFRKNDDPRLVSYAKQADEDAALAKQEREARETAEFAKQAEEAPYKGFSIEKAKDGETQVSKADVVRAIAGMDEGPRAVLLKWLEVGGKAIDAAFNSIGHSHEQVAKHASDWDKRVSEIQKRDGIDKLKAMEKAQSEFPEEYAALQESGKAVN